MTPFQSHGRVIAGTVTVPSLDAALTVYRDLFGLIEVERGPVPADLAASWGCPANAGAPSALLQPASGAPCFIRLVEQPVPDSFVPTTSYGWASYEISVQTVFDWADRIAAAATAGTPGVTIIGPPREIPSLPFFVAMQMHGPGKEMLYFNEVRMDTPTTDLPKAQSPVDHIFITILAAHDRAASVAWYRDIIGLDEADSRLDDVIAELDGDDVDAIVQVGTNLSMVDLAAKKEVELGKPVIAINTATYWHGLRACGIVDKVAGFGRLLSEF